MTTDNVTFQMYVHLQVSRNGYFSMGAPPWYSSLDNSSGVSSYVAPFAANIDTSRVGSVKYSQFTVSDYSQMRRVSRFIRSQTGNSFYGSSMMVAEWNDVPEYDGSIVSCKVSTFGTMFLHVHVHVETFGIPPEAVFFFAKYLPWASCVALICLSVVLCCFAFLSKHLNDD